MIYKPMSVKLLGPLISNISGNSSSRALFYHRTWVLLLTFLIYATYRLSRRPLSIAKSVFHNEKCLLSSINETQAWKHQLIGSNQTHNASERSCGWEPFDGADGKQLLGLLDTCFLFMYMAGMYGNGYLADRINVRTFLTLSLLSCGAISVALGLARPLEIHSLPYFLVLQGLAGYASASMPAMISVVGQWFGSAKKGLIFGIWNWHGSVGTILGSIIAGFFIEGHWELSFIVPGAICIAMAGMVMIFLIAKPSDVGLDIGQSPESAESPCKKILDPEEEKAISFWNALMIPGVIEFSIAQFFTKLVNYTFLYWLPLFLKETTNISPSKSAYASIIFDIGGCVGSMAAGLMADWTGTSALTCIFFLTLSIPSLYSFYLFAATGALISSALQFTTGLLINGPFCLIMSTISTNLACKVPSKSSMATVSGIVNGTGSIGAALGPLLAGFVSNGKNWQNVFYMAIVSCVCATVSLSRIAVQEIRYARKDK